MDLKRRQGSSALRPMNSYLTKVSTPYSVLALGFVSGQTDALRIKQKSSVRSRFMEEGVVNVLCR